MTTHPLRQPKNVLVTGCAGFIGSHLVERLVEAPDVRVVGVDNLSTGKESNIAPFLDRFEFVQADIRNRDSIESALEGVDTVFHLAALGSVPRSVDNPQETHANNVNGTVTLLDLARRAGVSRFVFSSSSSVYGDQGGEKKVEGMVTRPLSPYAASKVAGEAYCYAFASSYGLETVALRYFNVYGPRQDPNSRYAAVVPKFFKAALVGEPLIVYGNGNQTRDFTFVRDVVQANLLAASVNLGEREPVVCNVGRGEPVSVNDLARLVCEFCASPSDVVHDAPRKGDVLESTADASRAASVLGFHAETSLAEGLKAVRLALA